MPRAPFEVLVYPYRKIGEEQFEYALMKRADAGYWQAIAGGGEDDETPLEAARRETYEETGIPPTARFMRLDTVVSVPVIEFRDSHLWGDSVYVVPQYCFGVTAPDMQLVISHEHTEARWLSYAEAYHLMKYDGNRTALWELDTRLRGNGPWG